jgi:hypothetical protein
MAEALILIAELIETIWHLPQDVRSIDTFIKECPGISIGVAAVIVAGSLVAVLIRRVRHDSPMTIR